MIYMGLCILNIEYRVYCKLSYISYSMYHYLYIYQSPPIYISQSISLIIYRGSSIITISTR